MPIQEEENASGKPAAKARPILKPSSTSGWVFTPIDQRQWIDIETQESNDPPVFKCREADGAVLYDQVIDECQKK